MGTDDDVWLPVVGSWGWTVLGHEYSFHENENELAALRDHNIGAFYLYGAEDSPWEVLRAFVRGYVKIVRAIDVEPRPFVFRVSKAGGLSEVHFPI
jgi:hypothetical protein